jgi:hypothetical protein
VCVVLIYGFAYQAKSRGDNGEAKGERKVCAWSAHNSLTRTQGMQRLLILDGYKSYRLLRFNSLCKEKDIILLYMLAHASHLLQPLNVSCFRPLKTAYGYKIKSFARNYINYITKLEFLLAFRAAFYKAFTEKNICLSF